MAAAQSGAQSVDKYYFDLDVGAAVPQNTGIRVSPLGNDGNVKYNTGFRGDLNFGYNFTPHFAAELESGVIWNGIHSIRDNTLTGSDSRADLFQFPALANFIYKPMHGAFQPYLGVGVGGEAAFFDSANVPLFGSKFTDTDFTFAYQAKAGFKYEISSSIELGIAYKFLGTSGHNWSDNGVTFKTDGTITHALEATFTWQF